MKLFVKRRLLGTYGRSLQCKQSWQSQKESYGKITFATAFREFLHIVQLYYYSLLVGFGKKKRKQHIKVSQRSICYSTISLQTSCSTPLTLHTYWLEQRRGVKVWGWKRCGVSFCLLKQQVAKQFRWNS